MGILNKSIEVHAAKIKTNVVFTKSQSESKATFYSFWNNTIATGLKRLVRPVERREIKCRY